MAFVLDASAALPWCFSDEISVFTESLLARAIDGEELFVPAHWPTEVLSALMQGERRGRISNAKIERFLRDLTSLHIIIEESYSVGRMQDLKALAEMHHLTAYDAAYLDVAKRNGLLLATLDQRLRQASLSEGVLLAE